MKSNGRIFQLPTEEIPRKWTNIIPDLPEPLAPMLNPADGTPVPLQAMQSIFPDSLLEQEVSQKPEIDIPEDIME
ncbi:MAG TPA: TrpB-like pyridoxal-phosphate dependent enzyme, partial [Clostridia bacterium]|nr:TrpB-like pyridoxal-phosphate dependent enzyme [Clostridia bacterium]